MVLTIGLGQGNQRIDSLISGLNHIENDSLKVSYMLAISLKYGRSNIDSAEWYGKRTW
ncbi:MAG: hypothetical protein OEW67_14545 [Cyclobacteriaceae bacterium]|nr:hypothetical protein [Cyclobacteriaceae bacterium]